MAIDVVRKGDNYQSVCNSLEKNNLIKRRGCICVPVLSVASNVFILVYLRLLRVIAEGSGCMHDDL
jgi:hypothetical protein